MSFSERLRALRLEANLTQKELAAGAGISERTVQNYESDKRLPHRFETVKALADVLGVSTQSLLGEEDMLVIQAGEKGGPQAKKDIKELVGEISSLFAGGKLSDEDRDAAMRALNEAYWIAKEKDRK